MPFKVTYIRDVSEGLQPGQFEVGERAQLDRLEDLDPIYKQLLDEPVTSVIAVIGSDGRPSLTPVWFLYEGDKVLFNFAAHRKKTKWLHQTPQVSALLMNPQNAYHWVSLKVTVVNEIHEDDPEQGHRATETIDRAWTKYLQQEPPYGLRDPSIDERRVLFECRVDTLAAFGKP